MPSAKEDKSERERGRELGMQILVQIKGAANHSNAAMTNDSLLWSVIGEALMHSSVTIGMIH